MRVAVLVLTACGRIAFDPIADARSIPDGAVLWLPMDKPPLDGSVEDVARGHLVTCMPSCPSQVIGRHGGAHAFDGSMFLSTPFVADLDPAGGFTVATWCNLAAPSISLRTALIAKAVGIGGNDTYALFIDSSDLATRFETFGAQQFGPVLALGEWRHLALSWDGVRMRGYLDGALLIDVAATNMNDTQAVFFGADDNGGITHQLIGALDDVMIFSRALSDTEIAELAR